MCLYPRFIRNKRYFQTISGKKKIYNEKLCDDYRKLYVPIGCGECLECRRQKSQAWRVRLLEELKVNKYAYFITLTFSNEELEKLCKETDTIECNAVATLAVRRFLERWRKTYKKSLRHWLITELGHENTERIHLHGIIFSNDIQLNEELLQKYWKYGKTDIGEYCNEKTINYIVKYVTKIDTDHKDYKAVILCSAGLGEAFTKTLGAQYTYKYKKGATPEYYTLNNGNKVALPIYYRNKLFTEEEREKMWTDRLDKGSIYVNGIEIKNVNTEEGQRNYYKVIENAQRENKAIGYGSTEKEWEKQAYNVTFKMLQSANPTKKNNK